MRRCAYCHQFEDEADTHCRVNSAHRFEDVAAFVQPVTRDHLKIALSPGYTAVSFNLANGGAEVVILDKRATETTRLAVAPPAEGHTLHITSTDDGVEIVYERKQ